MNSLLREDLLLYLSDASLSDEEKVEIEAKLKQSPDFQIELEKLKQQMAGFRRQNEQERALIFDHLLDYLDGKIMQVNGLDFAQLLEEHPDCKAIYRLLQHEMTLEEAEQLDYPVSEELRHKFDFSPAEHRHAFAPKLAEAFYRILVEPFAAPQPAFLGETPGAEAKIKIPGDAFAIDVGAPGLVVKVFSSNRQELDAGVSDENGKVLFRDFEPDEYWIKVEGFKIQEVQQVR